MRPEGLKDLIDRCGSRSQDWPEGARAGVERLLRRSPEARTYLALQREVDAWLAGSRSRGDGATDIAARAMETPQNVALPFVPALPPRRLGVAAAGVVFALLGFGVGAGVSPHDAGEPTHVLAKALASYGNPLDVD